MGRLDDYLGSTLVPALAPALAPALSRTLSPTLATAFDLTDWPTSAPQLDNGLALILLTLPAGTARPAAHLHARKTLRQILGSLLNQPADTLTLHESPHGPVLENAPCDLRISLSYAANRCLIGIAEGRAIGVDLVRIETLPEDETRALSSLYLPVNDCHTIEQIPATMRDTQFALAWAQMEARSKCLGLPLAEITPAREQALDGCVLIDCVQSEGEGYRMALAVKRSQNFANKCPV